MSDPRTRVKAMNRDGRQDWYRISAKGSTKTARVDIFDEIGFWGVAAADLVESLNALDVETIDLHINSPGGDVFDGVAIYNALRDHKARVIATVDGVAASAASFIAMAGDEVVMNRFSELMIHDAWGLVVGNAADMADMSERLNKQSNKIASIYADRAGGSIDFWRGAMADETWYSAEEAVSANLADRVVSGKQDSETAKNRFDLSVFNHAGRDKAPAPSIAPDRNAHNSVNSDPETSGITTNEDATVRTISDNKQEDPLTAVTPEKLGLPETATQDEVEARIAELLALETKQEGEGGEVQPVVPATPPVEPATDPAAPGTVPESTPATEEEHRETAPLNSLPPGVVAIDESTLNSIKASAARGEALWKAEQNRQRDEFLNSAMSKGKFEPHRYDDYKNAWDNEIKTFGKPNGIKASIESLADNLVPTTEIGHGKDAVQNSADGPTEYSSDIFPFLRNQQGAAQ